MSTCVFLLVFESANNISFVFSSSISRIISSFFVKYKESNSMDNPSKNQASASDDRFLVESMLRRITSFGPERDSNQTKHWMPDNAGKRKFKSTFS